MVTIAASGATLTLPSPFTTTRFQVAFDVATAAEPEKLNRQLESAARFINMHVAAGVPKENLKLAMVVHGGAAIDLTSDAKFGSVNPNAGLIAALQEAGVSIQLCGQTAVARDIRADDLLPGVTVALSAMTAHAQLQQAGYTLNPF
ncbi:DsrE family protein [Novilysobacter avium]|uniref:DsrE family protein n=1 Tax=Novilysobacter avium TaxID=2781023 RepID=A0A7S6UME8_9GAMM|nr:DsrE family protein [Lysobacter avium]QOW23003.1 DsrE family protein [Lysobacter avium]